MKNPYIITFKQKYYHSDEAECCFNQIINQNKNMCDYDDKDGLNILLISGVHGNELTPIKCLMNIISKILSNEFKLNKNHQTITFINGININAIQKIQRDIPEDKQKDLNRSLIYRKFNPIDILKHFIEINDIIIDVHSSQNIKECGLIDINEKTDMIANFYDSLKIPFICRYSNRNTIKKYALDQNKIGLTIELNGMNTWDERSIQQGTNIIIKILKNLNKNSFINSKERKEKHYSAASIERSKCEGFFIQNIKSGEYITNISNFFGVIIDLSGQIIDICYPSQPGLFMGGGNNGGYVNIGDEIGYIQSGIDFTC